MTGVRSVLELLSTMVLKWIVSARWPGWIWVLVRLIDPKEIAVGLLPAIYSVVPLDVPLVFATQAMALTIFGMWFPTAVYPNAG